MSANVVLTNGSDTYVDSAFPTKNFSTLARMYINGTSKQAFLYFGLNMPRGVNVLTAKVYLYSVAAQTGTQTVNLARAAKYTMGTVTYNTRPAVTGSTASLAKTAPAANAEWSIDVTQILQAVADGGAWYGFRISGADLRFYTSQATVSQYRPRLEITWSEAPDVPDVLNPSGGRSISVAKPLLMTNFHDTAGNMTMNAIQVQYVSDVNATSVTFDSGVVSTDVPHLDTGTYLGTPIVVNATTTNASTNLTGTGFSSQDVGALITGTGIPAGATIAAYISATQVTLSSAATASGTVSTSRTRVFPSIADGATFYWRVQVQDGAGLWSGWSAVATAKRTSKGVLTITTPAVSPNNVVEDPTPPVAWTFTGRTQKSYQIIIGDATVSYKWLWDSGKITSTANNVTIPAGIIKDFSATYRLWVRIWDTVDRQSSATSDGVTSDTPFIQVFRDFTYRYDATVNAVTSLTMVSATLSPGAQLQWNRTSTPDDWTILRDGVPIAANVPGPDLLVSGTSYKYVDQTVGARANHTWTVIAHVNGKSSASNPTVTGKFTIDAPWLMDLGGTNAICMYNPTHEANVDDGSEVFFPLGDGVNPVMISQGNVGGAIGSHGGRLSDLATSGVTAAVQLQRFKNMAKKRGQTLRLFNVDQNMEVVIRNVDWNPVPHSDGSTSYDISFDFFEVNYS